jgi:hypothetical protein
MKKIAFLFLYVFLAETTNRSFAMEEPVHKEEKWYNKISVELFDYIIDINIGNERGVGAVIACNKRNSGAVINYTNEFYFLQPRCIKSTSLRFDHNEEHYEPSMNLNTLKTLHAPTELFQTQCWNSKKFSNYRIDNDQKRKRYLRSFNGDNPIDIFFDGPNDNDLILVVPNMANDTYKCYIGLFTDTYKKFYGQDDPSSYYSDFKRTFDYESKTISGKASAAALCKNSNHIALATTANFIRIFQINKSLFSFKPSNVIQASTPETIKKISFITPRTLLALTEKGNLFIVAVKRKKGLIKFFKQTIKNKARDVIAIKNMAVDACHPYQIILDIGDQILYWDLKHKILSSILRNRENPKARERLWFYNDTIGYLLEKNNQRENSQQFISFALTYKDLEHLEKPIEQPDIKSHNQSIKKKKSNRFINGGGITGLTSGILLGYFAVKKLELTDWYWKYPCIALSGLFGGLLGKFSCSYLKN